MFKSTNGAFAILATLKIFISKFNFDIVMSKERYKIIPTVYLVLIRENKILLLRRYNTGFMDGYYSFPAGHVEANETLTQAMVREAKEEIGVDIKKRRFKINSRDA